MTYSDSDPIQNLGRNSFVSRRRETKPNVARSRYPKEEEEEEEEKRRISAELIHATDSPREW